MIDQTYSGYLTPYVELILAMFHSGADTREIAEALYKIGARANTTDPNIPKMPRDHHIRNLRLMVLHVLQRHGFLMRKKRIQRWSKAGESDGCAT